MPLPTTFAGVSSRGEGLFNYISLGSGYWVATLTDTYSTPNDVANGITVDSLGNIYVCGYGRNSSNRPVMSISKYDTSGTIQWQNTLTDTYSTPNDISQGIAVDSSGNVYVCGYGLNSSGKNVQFISKWNTSGTIQWQRTLTDTNGSPSDIAQGIAVDSSGNVYVCGYGKNSSAHLAQSISKYNNAGTVQWQRTLTDTYTTPSDDAYGIAVDSSGNVYVCGLGQNSSGFSVQSISKYNTSGTIQWQKTLADTSSSPNDAAQGIAVDSSGNVYVCGYGNNSSGFQVMSISKYDTSGTIQWQNTLTDTYAFPSDAAYGIAVDSSGNVYVCGYGLNSSGQYVQFISKWNTSGTIQWQRTLSDTYTTPSDAAYGIAVDSSGNVYVCGQIFNSSGRSVQSIAKLPADGSKTGTYSGTHFGVTYAVSSWTAATSSWTSATSSWTSATSSWTSASSSWTSATSTWTTDKALIP